MMNKILLVIGVLFIFGCSETAYTVQPDKVYWVPTIGPQGEDCWYLRGGSHAGMIGVYCKEKERE